MSHGRSLLSPTLGLLSAATTDTSGQVTLTLGRPGNPGVWDYTIHAASSQHTIRIHQQGAAGGLTSLRSWS